MAPRDPVGIFLYLADTKFISNTWNVIYPLSLFQILVALNIFHSPSGGGLEDADGIVWSMNLQGACLMHIAFLLTVIG